MSGDGSAAPAGLTLADYIQPNLRDGLRIWWALYWRNTLVTAILVLQLEAASQTLYDHGLLSGSARAIILQFGPYVLNYVTAIFVMHYIARKRFRDYRIGLVSTYSDARIEVLPATRRRTFRIWWTYTWRTVLYIVILTFVTAIPVGFATGAVAALAPWLGTSFSTLVGLAIAAASGLYAIYSNILDEEIADFRVSLLPNDVRCGRTQEGS